MKTSKKLLAGLLSLALCISMTACGSDDEDSSSKGRKKDEESSVSTVTAADTVAEIPADTQAPETSAPAETEKPPETEAPAETEKPVETEPPAETEKPAETDIKIPDPAEGETVKGTGYTVALGEGWISASDAQKSSEALSEIAGEKLGLDASKIESMDMMYFYDDGDLSDGAPAFSVAKPLEIAQLKDYDPKMVNELMTEALKEQSKTMSGVTLEVKESQNINGADFAVIEMVYDMPDIQARSRQYYTYKDGFQYIISFSVSPDQFKDMEKEFESIMKSFSFTED